MLAGKQWFSTLDLASGQDGVGDAFWAVPVQGHAIRTVQCTGHIRETNG